MDKKYTYTPVGDPMIMVTNTDYLPPTYYTPMVFCPGIGLTAVHPSNFYMPGAGTGGTMDAYQYFCVPNSIASFRLLRAPGPEWPAWIRGWSAFHAFPWSLDEVRYEYSTSPFSPAGGWEATLNSYTVDELKEYFGWDAYHKIVSDVVDSPGTGPVKFYVAYNSLESNALRDKFGVPTAYSWLGLAAPAIILNEPYYKMANKLLNMQIESVYSFKRIKQKTLTAEHITPESLATQESSAHVAAAAMGTPFYGPFFSPTVPTEITVEHIMESLGSPLPMGGGGGSGSPFPGSTFSDLEIEFGAFVPGFSPPPAGTPPATFGTGMGGGGMGGGFVPPFVLPASSVTGTGATATWGSWEDMVSGAPEEGMDASEGAPMIVGSPSYGPMFPGGDS
mgnify:CR=1 FL=1